MISFIDITTKIFSESEKPNTEDTQMFSESEIFQAYEEAMYVNSSMNNVLVATSKVTRMFAESLIPTVGDDTVELYMASAFDKVKGFISGVITAVIKALKSAYNYIAKLGSNFVKLFMKNFGQLEKKVKEFKELTASRKDLKSVKYRHTLNKKVSGVYEGSLLRFLLSCVAFWQSNIADVFPMNSTELRADDKIIMAHEFYTTTIDNDILKVIKGLREDKGVPDGVALHYPENSRKDINSIATFLRNNKTGYTGEGNAKIEQQCYFMNVIVRDAQKLMSAMVQSGLGIDVKDYEGKGLSPDEIENLQHAKRLQGANEMLNSTFDTRVINSVVHGTFPSDNGVKEAVSAGVKEMLDDLYKSIQPEGKKDLKSDVVNMIFAKKYFVTDISSNDAWYMTLLLAYGCCAFDVLSKRMNMQEIKDNIKKGADFFRKSVKTFENISNELIEVASVKEGDNVQIKGIIERMSASVVEVAKITSWYSTGIIQLYSISDKITFKGIAESIKEIDTCSMLMTTVMTDSKPETV